MDVLAMGSLLCAKWAQRSRGASATLVMLFLVFLLPVTGAFAQESGRDWKIIKLNGELQGGFKSQQEAEKAMQSLGPGYEYMRFVRRLQMEEGEIEYVYWMGIDAPEVQPWEYSTYGSPTSDEEMINNYLAYYNQRSIEDGCQTGAYLESSSGWYTFFAWPDGVPYREWNNLVFRYHGDSSTGANCVLIKATQTGDRWRDRCANPYMTYYPDENICWAKNDEAYVISTPLACDACTLIGNPADFSTGDKFETELDFDLGWIKFERYYHSATSNGSGFGYGWTHNHNLRLTISGSHLGLVRANGSHQSFRELAFQGPHEATDGSGDRIVASGDKWVLSQSDRTLIFDAEGRILEQRFEDGTSLTYAYETNERLKTITHSTGRVLVFHYVNGDKDSPIASLASGGKAVSAYSYSAGGQVILVSLPGGDWHRYHYEDTRFPQNLTGITNGNNQRFSTFAYDDKGRLISSKHAGNVDSTTLVYSAQGGAIATDALGHPTTYGLTADSGDGRPRQAGDAADSRGTIARTYYDQFTDFRRRLKSVMDRNGVQTNYGYSEGTLDNQAVSITTIDEAANKPEKRTRITYKDLATNRLLFSKVGNRETRIVRNARLQPASVTVKDTATPNETRTTTYTYCEQADVTAGTCPLVGQVIKVDGPRTDVADVTTYTYRASDESTCATAPTTCPYRKGDLWKVTNALGHVVELLKYDHVGRLLSVKDANGVVTDYGYTPQGWLSAKKLRGADNAVETDDQITSIEYWPTGRVKKITDPTGAFSSFTYDAAERLTDIVDDAGSKIHYALDNAGNRTKEETYAAGNTTPVRTLSRLYNVLGQLETSADADNNPTDFTYDGNDNLKTVTDPLEHLASHGYDALNRLTSTLEDETGLSVKTIYEYDALDNLTKVTDPRQKATTYTYNAFGEVKKEVSPDRGTTNYTYDSAGNLKTKTDARVPSVTTTYEYDALNRVAKITAGSEVQTFAYDTCTNGKGRLCSTTATDANTQFSYTRDGQIATRREIMTVGGVQSNYPTTYGYDVAGRLTTIQYVNGVMVTYGYTRGKPVSMKVKIGTAETMVVSDATYEPFGPASGWTYGNGLKRLIGFNQDGQPIAISTNGTSPLQSLTYRYDNNNRIDKITNYPYSTNTQEYGYDGLSRARKFILPVDGTWTYSYDSTGNRTKLEVVKNSQTIRTDTYAVDSANNRLNTIGGGQTAAFGYDAAGNTTSAYDLTLIYNSFNRLKTVSRSGVAVGEYRYNVFSERVTKKAGTLLTRYLYDMDSRLIAEHLDNGDVWTNYLWFGGELVGIVRSGQLYYIHNDHLGRPELVTDAAKAVKWRGNNYPFNRTVGLDAIGGLNVGFPGQYFDAESGFFYNIHRYYDQNTGKYLQVDPIGLQGGTNPYAYVRSNPVNLIDLLGLADQNFIPSNDTDVHAGIDVIPHVAGEISVGVHYNALTENFIGPDGKNLSIDKLAEMIKNGDNYNATDPIRLYACNAAVARKDGKIPAHELAKLLPNNIIAADTWVWVGKTQGYLGLYVKGPGGVQLKNMPGNWVGFNKNGVIK